ncbi:MAG: hypothetical protein IJ691_01005 [Lachnospiraceae bacterium]|nr:hypothetical protein [Lachnospiraceae bacterium]
MDKYEYKVRAQEIRDLIAANQYEKAAEIADTIDWSRVKKSTFLCTISDLYKINKRYEDAIELLQLAYDRYPGGKDILYSLCELYLSTGDTIRAISTYKEFCQVAGNDIRKYILQYKVYVAQEVSLEERIEVLEELKKRDYREKWAYTLAYLYHRVGLATKCVEECDELISWFGEGKYVDMAMELKMLHQPLDEKQQELYNHRIDSVVSDSRWEGKRNSNAAGAATTVWNPQAVSGNQEAPADGGETKVIPDIYSQGGGAPIGEVTPLDEAVALSLGHTQVYKGNVPEPEINVKTVDVGDYNTINLQQALAQGVQQVLENGVTTTLPMMGDEGFFAKKDTKKIIGFDEQTVLQSDTKEIPGSEDDDIPPHIDFDPHAWDKAVEEEISENNFDEEPAADYTQYLGAVADRLRKKEEQPEDDFKKKVLEPMFVYDTVAMDPGAVAGQLDEEAEEVREEAMTAQPPEQIATVLSQEGDGQIRFVVPEAPSRDKQITGQLNINDVMAEWARMKREHEELNRKQYHEQVKQQTGELFDEFEAAALNGVLETLQKESEQKDYKDEAHPGIESSDIVINTFIPDNASMGAEVAAMMDAEAEEAVATVEAVAGASEAAEAAIGAEVAGAFTGAAIEEAAGLAVEAGLEAAAETEDASDVITDTDEVEELEEISDSEENYTASEEETFEETYVEPGEEVCEEESEAYEETYEDTFEEGYSGENYEEGNEEAYYESEGYDVAYEGETYDESGVEEADGAEEPATEETDAQETEDEAESEAEPSSDVFDIYPTRETIELPATNRTKEFYERKHEEAKKQAEAETPEDDDDVDVRELTKEENELFGPYIQSKSARKQLVGILDGTTMASYSGNIILTGGDGNDTSDLATAIMKDIKQTDSNFSGKVARIGGDKLNNKKMATVVKQLASGGLIIEKAGKMSTETANDLYKSLDTENLGIIVTLIDTERSIEKLLARAPKLEDLFTVKMNLKPLTAEQLADFAVKYAYEKEYSIDEMGMLALHTQITLRQTATHSVNIVEVREIVDNAINNVRKKSARHFFDVLLGKRYDDEDMIILGEKDFG